MEERYYAEYARVQATHWWFAGRRRIIGALLERALAGAGDERRILDVGCGTGANLDELARFGRVEGVDPDPAAVEFAGRAGGPPITQAGGDDLPFPDEAFDVVTLLDVIEHAPDDTVVLREAARVLRPDGVMLLTVPAYTWMWGAQDVISHHHRRYTAPRLRTSLGRAALKVERTTYFNTLLFPPIAAVRLLRRLRPAPEDVRSDFEMGVPGPANRLLGQAFALEAPVVSRVRLPFGVSLAAVALRAPSPTAAAPP